MNSAEAHAELVARLERQARQAPGTYKFKLGLLAMLGYAVLGLSMLLAASLTVGLLVLVAMTNAWLLAAKLFKFLFVPLGIALVILRALLVKISAPEGVRLSPGQAPELEAEVERLRCAAGAPRLSGIIIDRELNAAAVSIPRMLGLLGNRHYLVLGLPLMQLLDRRELAAVIAHEFGHFGGGHGRFAGWIYRVRESWFRLLHALQARGAMASRLYVRFFDWYAPYFNAYSFVLARANEYEADAVSATVAGSDAAGNALVRISLAAIRLDHDFWPAIQDRSNEESEPPRDLYVNMRGALSEAAADDASRLEQILEQQPNLHDTHPVLRQRLAALGVEPVLPEAPHELAAEALLGQWLPELEERFSEEWADQVEMIWRDNHEAAEQDRRRIAELERLAQSGGLSDEEANEHACLVYDRLPEVDARPLLESALDRRPDDATLLVRFGALRLDRRDERGVEDLRRAMTLDARMTESALYRLAEYFQSVRDRGALAEINEEIERFYATRAANDVERNRIDASDVFLPHDLDGEQQQELFEALDGMDGVSRIWLVRKKLDDDQGFPHFIGLVHWKKAVPEADQNLQMIVDTLRLPGSFLLIDKSFNGRVRRRIKNVSDVPVYCC